ncbi:MAG: exopolyphosphatase [Slackia sp.]|nr:exopolyphosphatase [Slackia sp.]
MGFSSAIAGNEYMNYGVIDVGSNTVRLCVYDVSSDGKKFKTILNRKSMAGLAAYVQDGMISDEGVQVAAESVRKCLKRASYLKPARVDVFATAVLRNIANSAEAIAAIEDAADCTIALLSEEDEAHLGFVGASSKDDLANGVLVDIGGGSSEVTLIADAKDVMRASLPLGSLSSYRRHVCDIMPTEKEFRAIQAEVRALLEADVHGMAEHRVRRLFGVGGSVRALAEVNAHLAGAQSDKDMSHDDVHRLVDDMFAHRRAFLDAVLHIAPERIHTIACGLAILTELFDDFDADTLHVCSNGVREGYLLERILKSEGLQ